jgi:hypothetical protein
MARMNKIESCKRKILSVLIFSFLFLALHDFAMPKVEPQKSYELSSKKIQLSDEIHESIHTLLAIQSSQTPLIPDVVLPYEQSWTIFGMSSVYNFVLERPPLS